MSDLSDKKPAVTESLDEDGRHSAPRYSAKGKPVQIWAAFGGAILLLQLYVWTRWVTGPYFEQVPAGPTRSADVHEDPAHRERGRPLGRPAVRRLVLLHPAMASRAADHAGRHAGAVDGPDVLPGSVPELLQHVVHLQHLAVQPRRLDAAHPRLVVTRRTGPHGARTAADELGGLRVRSPADHDHRMRGDAQDQVALAQHQQSAADPGSPSRSPLSSTS